MALSLLLDENISPVVADQISLKWADIPITSLYTWRQGACAGISDETVLASAFEDGLTLVTYDTQILSELAYWFEQDLSFAGLIFVDDRTIAGNDFGGLVNALTQLWEHQHDMCWADRLVFLAAPLSP